MGRPKKQVVEQTKQVIKLQELEDLYREHRKDQGPRVLPMELNPQFLSICQRNPMLWTNTFNQRKQQLLELGLLETHEIDFYQNNKQPSFMPF
jgi:hypothetical protein